MLHPAGRMKHLSRYGVGALSGYAEAHADLKHLVGGCQVVHVGFKDELMCENENNKNGC